MKKVSKLQLIISALISSNLLAIANPIRADMRVINAVKIYEKNDINWETFSDSDGQGIAITSSYNCSSNVLPESDNAKVALNKACINQIIESTTDKMVTIAPSTSGEVLIKLGSDPKRY